MSDVTNLRQAENKVEIMGILAEKDIKPGKNKSNGKDTLEGSVSVKIDEINTVKIWVSADVTKKDGDPNPAYESLQGFNQNAVSIAEGGIDNASRVVSNSVQLSPYHSSQSNSDIVAYRTGFISVYRGEDFEPKAQLSVELFIKSITPETDKEGNETGRALLRGWMPTYNGIEPLTLVAPSEIAGDLESAFNAGETAKFYADIINSRVEKIKEIPMRLGPTRIERTFDYTNELILTGASDAYDEDNAFNPDAVKKAIQEREDKIRQGANKPAANTTTQSRPSGAAMGRSTMGW